MKSDPREWFDGRARVMFVHAHPDDETITTGGTLAALAEAGREPLLVTLSRGERGEVVPGPLEGLVAAHGLAVVRQNELRTALGMLAVERHAFLGVPPARAEGLSPVIYEDSGMAWGPDGRAVAAGDAGPDALTPRSAPWAAAVGGTEGCSNAARSHDALTSVPAVEVLNDLLAAAYQSGAGAIVSYDDGGGYGHPDHVLAHRIARAVAHALDLPFWEIAGGEEAETPPVDAEDADPRPVESHDVSPWLDRKVAALRAHATQLTVDGDDIVHVGGQRQPIDRVERFRRAG